MGRASNRNVEKRNFFQNVNKPTIKIRLGLFRNAWEDHIRIDF